MPKKKTETETVDPGSGEAVQRKIEADRARLRELKRQEAMKGYGRGRMEDAFEAIAGEDFADARHCM
jgi:hypothetical protein